MLGDGEGCGAEIVSGTPILVDETSSCREGENLGLPSTIAACGERPGTATWGGVVGWEKITR